MADASTTWDDVLTAPPPTASAAAPRQAKRSTVGWDDLLSAPAAKPLQAQPTAAPSMAPAAGVSAGATSPKRPAQRGNAVGWDDLLTQPAAKPAQPQPPATPSLWNRALTFLNKPIPSQADPFAMPPELPSQPEAPTQASLAPTQPQGATISAYRPTVGRRIKDWMGTLPPVEAAANTIAEPVLGRIGVYPNRAERPEERQLVGHPELLISGEQARTSPVAAATRGVLGGAGGMTAAPNVATMIGAAATGGLLGPAGIAANRLISMGFSVQMAKDIVTRAPHLLPLAVNDPPKFYEELGRLGFDVTMLGTMASHAAGREMPLLPGRTEADYRAAERSAEQLGVPFGRTSAPAGPGELTEQGADIIGRLPTQTPATERMAEQQYQRATGRAQERSVIEPKNVPIAEGAQGAAPGTWESVLGQPERTAPRTWEGVLNEPRQPEAMTGPKRVEIAEKFPLTKTARESLARAGENPELQQQFARLGIKGLTVEAPHQFGLSEQANIDQHTGEINLNADVTDAGQSLAHELAHDIYKRLPTEARTRIERHVTDNQIEKQHAGGLEERIADHFGSVIAGQADAPADIKELFLRSPLAERPARTAAPKQIEPSAPKLARSLDDIRQGGGFLSDSDNIPALIKANGDFPVVVKDVNGWRHVMPATMFDKLTKTPADGFISGVWLPRGNLANEVKIDPGGQREFVQIANRVARQLKSGEVGAPGPGSTEYEALKARLARLEGKAAPAEQAPKPAINTEALRRQAETLSAQIEAKRNPAIAQQNITARRARIAEGMSRDADYLENIQRHLVAVADAADAGELPGSLSRVYSRGQIEDLLRHQSMPRMTLHRTYINDLLEASRGIPGTATARSAVSRALGRGEVPELYGSEEMAAAEKLMAVAEKKGVSTKYMRDSITPYKRALAAGLDTPEKWQQARQDLTGFVGKQAPARGAEQQIKAAERELIGTKIPGYFPTPKPLAQRLVEAAEIEPGMSVLEPSAGKGNIADAIREHAPNAKLDTVEYQDRLRKILELKGHKVAGADFLQHQGQYDRIVMNPPFEGGQDIEHVQRAYDLLNPGGRVVAVMSEGPFFRNDKKATTFRAWLEGHGAESEKLPQGSFTGKESERQTGAASRLVILDKPKPAARESISTARQPVAMQTRPAAPGEYGAPSVVKTPTSDLPARYKLVEASDLTPSHNAETFAPTPGYPPGVQERAYHTSKEAQARVIEQAQNYDARYTVNTNPDAVNGPPIITPDGTVLGGNSRTMSTQRLYRRGQGDEYRDYLRANAQQFGLDPAAIDRLKNPVLVREIPTPADTEAARRLGSELNKTPTGALGTSERAVSAGKSITPRSLAQISGMLDQMGPDSSIRDLLRERGRDVISLLTGDGAISPRERPQFVDTSTGGLSEEGKTFVERALLGTVVDDPTLMDRAPKSVLNKLDGSLADIASIAPRTDEYNLLPLVREAIQEHADIAARGIDVATHLAQTGMFGPERNPAVDAIVRKLAEKPKQVREAFRSFARDANADKQSQGFLLMAEKPSAVGAFNEAFGTKLTDAQFERSVLQSVEREAQERKQYAQASQPQAGTPDEGLRPERLPAAPAGPPQGNGGHQERAVAEPSPGPPQTGAVGEPGTLLAQTPFSVAKLALDRLNRFYDQKIAEPLIERAIKTGRTHPEIEKADSELADKLRLLDNAPTYFREKAEAIVRNVTQGLSREQERLFTLMADADSRENLRTNHPEEYRQAQSDSAIQAALRKYKPEETKLTEARKALGGEVIDDDYLRRVYDKYTGGINKREAGGRGITAYDRVIRPQRADKYSREAETEYHYQNGLHEFGPAFGTKYVATMIKVARDRVARDFLSKAAALEPGEYMPHAIEYNGKTYYSAEAARDMRTAGKGRVDTYGIYSPQANSARFLGPRAITDTLSGLDARDEGATSGLRRFLQEQVVGLGFGVPHGANIVRRMTQTAPGGALDPRGWITAAKAAFSQELKQRALRGVDDPMFDLLAQYGAISTRSQISLFRRYAGGNFNPANWMKPFAKVGHDWLFNPGGFDQRARLAVGDLVKSQHPEWSGSKIAQAVNETLGSYNRANWTGVQRQVSKFLLFPGWDLSSMNYVLRHPIKTTLPPALIVWAANQAVNALGGNRESDKNDLSNIHVGDRTFSTNLLREPLGRAIAGAPLRFGQAIAQGKSVTAAGAEAGRGLGQDISHPLNMLAPYIGGPIELATNRERIGSSREIVKSSDFYTPGRVLPTNAGLENLAWHAVSRMLPQTDRAIQASEGGKFDLAQWAGGNLGVYNYRQGGEERLRQKAAQANSYAQAKSAILKSNPQAIRELFTSDPDAAVYIVAGPDMQKVLGELRKVDQAKQIIASSGESAERKQQAITRLDAYRGQQEQKAAQVDDAVETLLRRVRGGSTSVRPNPSGPSVAPQIGLRQR